MRGSFAALRTTSINYPFHQAVRSRACASCQRAAAGTGLALGFLGMAVKPYCSRGVGGGFGRFRGCVHEAFPEASVFRKRRARGAAGARRVCYPKLCASNRSWVASKEFNSKLLPFLKKSVPLEDLVEPVRIQNSGFDKLQDASEVLGAGGSKGQGDQMFGGDHPRRKFLHFGFDRLRQRFLVERAAGREELHRPSFDVDVFLFSFVAA